MNWQQEILDIITSSSAPLCLMQINKKIPIGYKILKGILNELIEMGKIVLIFKRKGQKAYTLKTDDRLNLSTKENVNEKIIVRDYIITHNESFSILILADKTNVDYWVVNRVVKLLIKLDLIVKLKKPRGNVNFYKKKRPRSECQKSIDELTLAECFDSKKRIKQKKDTKKVKTFKFFLETNKIPFTYSKVMEETGLSKAFVYKYISDYINKGLIRLIGIDKCFKVFVVVRQNAKQFRYSLEYIQSEYAKQMRKQKETYSVIKTINKKA